MEKGFTLLEILTVIVILGLILVIALINIFDVMNGSDEAGLVLSTKNLINAADSYLSSEDCTVDKPNDGLGVVVSAEDLVTNGYLTSIGELEDSAVVLYNNAGSYEIYAFSSNDDFSIAGYKIDDLKNNVTATGNIDYVTYLGSTTDFYIDNGQLKIQT